MTVVNSVDKTALKQALASLVQRHEFTPEQAAVGAVEAVVHFGLQVGNLGHVSEMERYASRCTDGPNALWKTLPMSGQIVKRVKHMLPA